MTLFYQAVLRDGGQRLGPRLRRCFAAWAGVEDDGAPLVERTKGRTRVTLADTAACGRYTLDEPTGRGRLRTTATWAEGRKPDRNWVLVTVEGDLTETAGAVRAPGFVAAYLATGRATDGAVPVEAGAHVVGPEEVRDLTARLAHRSRAVPVIVLTVDRADPNTAAACADHLAEALAGVASVVRLYDTRTQDDLNTWLGADLSVFGGGLRTYLPGVRPGEESYAMRHQPRGGNAIREHGTRALDVVVTGVVELSVHRQVPADIRQTEQRVGRVLAGALDPAALHAAPPSPAAIAVPRPPKPPKPTAPPKAEPPAAPAAPEPPAATAPAVPEPAAAVLAAPADDGTGALAAGIAERLADHLDDAVLGALVDMARGGDSETTALIRTMSAHLEALTRAVETTGLLGRRSRGDEHDRLRREYDRLELDFVELQEQERKAQDRIRWLEGRLAEHADPVYGIQDDGPEGPFVAESLMDVVQRARKQLRRVELPDGLDTEVSRLDVTYPRQRRRWAWKAWDALRALDAYAAARAEDRFTGGFYDWCSRPLAGEPHLTPTMVSMKESDSVSGNPKFYRARVFRVAAEVDPSGRVYMPAHIKLQPIGSPAPRMHFLDDAGGATGRVWIGYLGDHLPNTRTN
ncbi:hypothetical protein SAMN05216298_1423 [Glycomyces sambucus]|uniref:Uncharacterized protein n=1 Tax=Glycomyces sambucus TaxID=380244 RepID=A0A1G9EVG5_9ACTN|nr:hypothetical protein [Glycomyces sambucus]SDK80156.1 hypothetical protein SAMN05216298_1423 [Glycomyces sambucus]